MNRQQAIAFHQKQLSPYATSAQTERHATAIARLSAMTDAEYEAERDQKIAALPQSARATAARMSAELTRR